MVKDDIVSDNIMENLRLTSNMCVENVIKLLNEKMPLSIITKAKICNYFYHYCLKSLKLNTQDIKFVIKKLPIQSYYNPAENEIGISYEFVEKKGALKIFNLIAHELRHCYQEKYKVKTKSFNKSEPITNELLKTTSDIFYIKFDNSISNFNYYITSKNEQDANNFSNEIIIDFLTQMYNNKNSSIKTKKFIKKTIKYIDKKIAHQNKQFLKAKQNISFSFNTLQSKAKNIINDELQYYSDYKQLKNALSKLEQLLYIYCDDTITNKLVQMGFENNDIKLLTMTVNHLSTNISKNTLIDYIGLLINNKINNEKMQSYLSNWNQDSINEALKSYSKQFCHHLIAKNIEDLEK